MESAGPATGTGTIKKKRAEKRNKKDPNLWENLSKSISQLEPDSQLKAIEEKYNEMYSDLRKLTATLGNVENHNTFLRKEIDHKHSELGKSIMARSRLEEVCRELQKQNRAIKEENSAKIKEEKERCKVVSARFADRLSHINNMIDENKEKSELLGAENEKMARRLAELYTQFEHREIALTKVNKQMETERKYFQMTVNKLEEQMKANKELYEKECTVFLNDMHQREKHIEELEQTIKGLKENLDFYKEKYSEIEVNVSKSNETFDAFRNKVSVMSERMHYFEEEATKYKAKWEEALKQVNDVNQTRTDLESSNEANLKQMQQLKKLCRQLQTDRHTYLNIIKAHGLDTNLESDSLSKKEKELAMLKDNLKAVQDQLTRAQEHEETSQPIENSRTTDETNTNIVSTIINDADTQVESIIKDPDQLNETSKGTADNQSVDSTEMIVQEDTL